MRVYPERHPDTRFGLAGENRAISTSDVFQQRGHRGHSVPVATGDTLDIELVADTPVHKQWWLWTGLGVLVAAGVVVAAVVTATAPADEGDIAPGQVEVGTVTIFSW